MDIRYSHKLILKLEGFYVNSFISIMQGLYAEVFLTYEQFNEMFDGETYRRVRKELPLTEEAFPEVYEKVSKIGRS